MIYRQTAIYKFLYYCNECNLEKRVVDCGAGGSMPPLGIFYTEGYKTIGVEMDDKQIALSKTFENKNNMNLNIMKGDMRKLPFNDCEIPYIYSFGSIFHMKKKDIKIAIDEIKRVMIDDGLCYINFLSKEDFRYGEGEKIGDGEFIQEEGGSKVIHSYFDDDEVKEYFNDMTIIYKENRIYERVYNGEMIKQGAIDYIVRK